MTELTREELEKQIKEYLAKGGTITKVPSGLSKETSKDFTFSKRRGHEFRILDSKKHSES